MRVWLGLVACVTLVAACGSGSHKASGASLWPAPKDPMARTRLAGLTPEPAEELFYHVHSHLDVFLDGKPIRVPAGIGIDITDPAVHTFDEPDGTVAYGGINPPCADPCISPLHTHADDGVLHTESRTVRGNELGEFFTEWNVRLTRTCVGAYCRPAKRIAVYVDGTPYSGDPRTIQLTNLREIAVVIGSPPSTIPSRFP